MKFKNLITQQEQKRTIKLLYHVRQKHGIDTYISLKKQLTVGIIVNGFQNMSKKRGCWITYDELLRRYERAYYLNDGGNKKNFTCDRLSLFYGFKGNYIQDYNLPQVENMVINRCMKEFNTKLINN